MQASFHPVSEQSAPGLQQKLLGVFERSPFSIFLTRADGTLEFVNPAFCQFQSCPGRQAGCPGCPDFLAALLKEDALRVMWREANQGNSWATELCSTLPDGQSRWQELRLSPLLDESGQLTGLLGTQLDITARKSAELALRVTSDKLHNVLLAAYDPIVVTDHELKIQLWNPAAGRVFGYEPEEASGRDLIELLLPPGGREEWYHRNQEFLLSPQTTLPLHRDELLMRRKDGSEILVDWSLSSVQFGDRWYHVGVGRDVTEQKKSETEREMLIKSLEEALVNVKTLRGLVPICAACKKVRDDKGFWNQVEAFVSAHSEARFSHGICPECARKLYPDFAPALEARFSARGRAQT